LRYQGMYSRMTLEARIVAKNLDLVLSSKTRINKSITALGFLTLLLQAYATQHMQHSLPKRFASNFVFILSRGISLEFHNIVLKAS